MRDHSGTQRRRGQFDSDTTRFLTCNNGYNCLLVIRDTNGTARCMGAYLKKSSTESWTKIDQGYHTHYAGPSYLLAIDSCVDWRGRSDTAITQEIGTNCGRARTA
ncbi:hypothetical protein [Nonomuraea candida]|uniref:hypothetical protein n=1 Tax=Nonomuraea candida TaxID=359159 RepID=UPI00069329DE|nr:hypothetical protein [Nonomuraea candida]